MILQEINSKNRDCNNRYKWNNYLLEIKFIWFGLFFLNEWTNELALKLYSIEFWLILMLVFLLKKINIFL
jgi:hypothetical protein